MDSDIAGALQRTFATLQHQSELKSYFLFSVTLLERFLEHKLNCFSVFIECKESETEDFQYNTNVKTTANAHVVKPLCPRSLPIYVYFDEFSDSEKQCPAEPLAPWPRPPEYGSGKN